MTNISIARDVLQSFSTGNITTAQNYLQDNYIQHNLAYKTGRVNFQAAIEALHALPTKTTVETIRAYEEGDYVFLHTVYNFAGAGNQVAFDVFRFEDGKIAEHWDNIDDVQGVTPSGHTQTDGEVEASDLSNTANNKQLVSEFVGNILRGEHPELLDTYFDGNNYIQHNITMADGVSGLKDALQKMADEHVEMVYDTTHKVFGQGNFVLAMSEGQFGGKHVAFYDLFRVKNNKIAEHWDVIQEIPDQTEWANNNGKF